MKDVKTINVFLENERVAVRFVKNAELADLIIREDGSVMPIFPKEILKENPIEENAVKELVIFNGNPKVVDSNAVGLKKYELDIPHKDEDIEIQISNLLKEIGFPAHIKGYPYTREAILLILKDGSILNKVTKELYPQIAEKYKSTSSRVERAIRHSIEVAFNRGNPDTISKLFVNLNGGIKLPNSEFLAGAAEYLRLKNKNIIW